MSQYGTLGSPESIEHKNSSGSDILLRTYSWACNSFTTMWNSASLTLLNVILETHQEN